MSAKTKGKKKDSSGKIVGAFLGTIVEYYDYSLYGFSAGVIAAKFFPTENALAGLMNAFAIYALAYVMKPLGAIFFSRMGDKLGRKMSLRITILGIAIPTLTIGLLPGYETIGYYSTFVLIICRLLQGFFVAGEYDGAAIYVIEHIGKENHYTASALTRATGVTGLLLGIACTNFFGSSIFPEWGWRIPFLLSLPLAMVTIYYRRFLEETPAYREVREQKLEIAGTSAFLKKQWRTLLLVILLAGGFGVTYQVSIIFMKQYLPIIMPKSSTIITTISVTLVFIFGISMPVAGLLADRFGQVRVVRYSLMMCVAVVVLLALAIQFDLYNLVLISTMLLAMAVAPFNALAHGVIVKSFPVQERYRGVSFGHTTGSMLMSGTANFVCLFMMINTNIMLFPLIYVGLFALLAYFAVTYLVRQYSK